MHRLVFEFFGVLVVKTDHHFVFFFCQDEPLSAIAPGVLLIALDRPGYGDSDNPPAGTHPPPRHLRSDVQHVVPRRFF